MSDIRRAVAREAPALGWCLDKAFVDWLTIRQPNDGRYALVNDGRVIRISPAGEVVFDTAVSIDVPGSFDSSARLRVTEGFLELVVNPSRFDRAENLFGYSFGDAVSVCNRILDRCGLGPLVEVGSRREWNERHKRFVEVPLSFAVNRVDMTFNVECGSQGRLEAYLRFLRRQTLPRRKTRVFEGSVIYKQKGSSLTVYDKGREMRAHGLGNGRELVADWCEERGVARVEFRLNREFLKRKDLRHGVTQERLVEVLKMEVSNLPRGSKERDLLCLSSSELGTFLMWERGFNPRDHLSQATWYRHRKSILEKIGFDIKAEPPLKFEAQEDLFDTKVLDRPEWYELPDVKEG